jgi:hypothetical protein
VTVIAEVRDPDGHRVELTAERWAHIRDEHQEMAAHRDAVLATVTAPEHVARHPRPSRTLYWRRGLGPSRWLLAVIGFGSDPPGWTP